MWCTSVGHMVTGHISRLRLLCQLLNLRTDSAVRHHDSQPLSRTARIPPAYTSLEPLGDVGGAGDLAAHRAKRAGRLLDPSFGVVVVRQVVVEERVEVDE